MKLSKNMLQKLKDGKIKFDELEYRYFFEHKVELNEDREISLDCPVFEDKNILKLLNNDICSFREIVNKFKNKLDNTPWEASNLYKVLENEELFNELIKNNTLTKEDLKYLFNAIDDEHLSDEISIYQDIVNLEVLCSNTTLIKYILNESLVDKEIEDRVNLVFKNSYKSPWFEEHNISDSLEYIAELNKCDEEMQKLIKTNKYVRSFNENQRLELAEALKNTTIALSRLKNIIENNLELNYNFDSLLQYLKKPEKKSILNI